MTSPLAEEKRIGWTSTPASCGVQTDLDELPSTGEVRLRIKESTREKVLQLVATILEEGHFGAGIQAHLTGKLGYVLLDKAGRAALQPLVDHVCDDGRSDLDQSMALSFIQKLLGGELPDKIMYSLQRKPPVTTVFSDASEEPPQPPSIWPVGRLAFIVFKPNGETVYAETLVPAEVFQLIHGLKARKKHICTLETMALIAVYINPNLQDSLRGADVNHFADNTAANGAAIKGYSPAPDIARLVGAYHLRIARLGARIWIEYVPSAANIADMPSRGNFELVESIGAKRIPFIFPSLASWGAMQ
jgi:hypothetical protein